LDWPQTSNQVIFPRRPTPPSPDCPVAYLPQLSVRHNPEQGSKSKP
jgi:hypothetical protein